MSGYCPAGKCECENYQSPGYCLIPREFIDELNKTQRYETISHKWESCPYPSRQVKVEPPTMDNSTTFSEWLKKAKRYGMESYQLGHSDGFASGRLSGLREARDVVEKCRCVNKITWDSDGRRTLGVFILGTDALAAIDKLIGVKE